MNKGHINSNETSHQEFIVETRLIDGNLWIIAKHEKADLLNVPVGMVGNYLSAIFRSDVLLKEDITRILSFERNGKPYETTLYSLETLIFISYRIALFEARAFRQWVMKALCEYSKNDKNIGAGKVLITCNSVENLPSIIHLN